MYMTTMKTATLATTNMGTSQEVHWVSVSSIRYVGDGRWAPLLLLLLLLPVLFLFALCPLSMSCPDMLFCFQLIKLFVSLGKNGDER